jgi:hypothetical protein
MEQRKLLKSSSVILFDMSVSSEIGVVILLDTNTVTIALIAIARTPT